MKLSEVKTIVSNHYGYTNSKRVNAFIEKNKIKALDSLPDSEWLEIIGGSFNNHCIDEIFNTALNNYGIPDHICSNRDEVLGEVMILVSPVKLDNPCAFWLFPSQSFECKSISSYSGYRLSNGIPTGLLSSTKEYFMKEEALTPTSFSEGDAVSVNGVLYSISDNPSKVWEVCLTRERNSQGNMQSYVRGEVCDKMILFMKKNFSSINISPFYHLYGGVPKNATSSDYADHLTSEVYSLK